MGDWEAETAGAAAWVDAVAVVMAEEEADWVGSAEEDEEAWADLEGAGLAVPAREVEREEARQFSAEKAAQAKEGELVAADLAKEGELAAADLAAVAMVATLVVV